VERLKLEHKTNSDLEQQNVVNSSVIEQAANNGSGQALDPTLRATLEPQFGHILPTCGCSVMRKPIVWLEM
jgi:hypothetical protein